MGSSTQWPAIVQRQSVSKRKDSRGVFIHSGAMASNVNQPRYTYRQKCERSHTNGVRRQGNIHRYEIDEQLQYHHDRRTFSRTECSFDDSSYIKSTCQLLVSEGGDSSWVTDPDYTVPWDCVTQINYHLKERLECPICLYPPVAPRMGKCGHIYCWHCAIQYLMFENTRPSKNCAVCSLPLEEADLKRVCIIPTDDVKVGCSLKLSLVRRKRSGCQVEAVCCASTNLNVNYSLVEQNDNCQTSTLDSQELEELLTHRAIMEADDDADNKEALPYILDLICSLETRLSISDGIKGAMCTTSLSTATHSGGDQYVYFYQGADGQSVYMHGLNWNCLVKQYPTTDLLPSTVCCEVLSVNHYRMNDVLRKRWRHLSHLPLGRVFAIAELDIKPPLVSDEVLEQFAPALISRQVERDRRRLKDLHLTKLKEEAENRIPTLPPGFTLYAPASLTTTLFTDADFVPLTRSPSQQQCTTPSKSTFAEITRYGASPVVGPDRVANFTRRLDTTQAAIVADDNREEWPQLTPKRDDDVPPVSNATWWRQPGVLPDESLSAKQIQSKKKRGRRTCRSTEIT